MSILLFLQEFPLVFLLISAIVGCLVGLTAWWLFFRGFYQKREGERRKILLTISALCLIVFGICLHSVLFSGPIVQWDEQVIAYFHSMVSVPTLQLLSICTTLGGPSVLSLLFILIAIILLLKRNAILLTTWTVAIVGNTLLNQGLKHIIQRSRPAYDTALLQESSWSFPSGHASGSMAVVGMLMYFLIRYSEKTSYKILILCVGWAWILSIMMSRVMLQVHYPSDVIAGAAISGAWIFLCAAWYEFKQKQYFYN